LNLDKSIDNLSKRFDRLDSLAKSGNGNIGYSSKDDDDEYYLAIGSEPPRFLYYRHVRAQEWEALGQKPWDNVYDNRITQDELDYNLKKELRVSPEQRYQHRKANWFFHESSYLHQTVDENGKAVDIITESGCGHGSNNDEQGCCVPECRYYPKYGRIEDEEVIEEHNKLVKALIQENAIVQPPDMNSDEAYVFLQGHP
jgi:hypothetical protein